MASEGFKSKREINEYLEGDLYEVTAYDEASTGIKLITSIQPLQNTREGLPEWGRDFLRVKVFNGETQTMGIFLFSDNDGKRILQSIDFLGSYRKDHNLTARQMHSIPIGAVRKELNKLLEHLEENGEDKSGLDKLGLVATLPDTGPVDSKRVLITDLYLLNIATIYNAQAGASGAVKHMSEILNVNNVTMRKHIQMARKRGFLEPTTAGKKNWNLTNEAKKFRIEITESEKGNE